MLKTLAEVAIDVSKETKSIRTIDVRKGKSSTPKTTVKIPQFP